MIEVSYIAAFFAGALMLLPSCGPFILPVFFAYGFKERKRLLASTFIFFLGFLATFLPLGLSITALVSFVAINKKILNAIAGALLILFALLALFGKSVSFVPSRFKTAQLVPEKKDFFSLFLFGAAFGLAATGCTAPVLGAILTVAAAAGIGFQSVTLLITFALGIIFPFFLLAFYLDEAKAGRIREWLFRHVYKINLFGKSLAFSLPNIISAVLFAALGMLFINSRASSPFLALGTQLGLLDFFFTANEKLLLWTDRLSPIFDFIFWIALLAFLAWLFFRKKKTN